MCKGGEPKEVNDKCPVVHPLENEDTSSCRAQAESVHGYSKEAIESAERGLLLPRQTQQSEGESENKGSQRDVVVDVGVPLQDVEAPCESSRQGVGADGSVPPLDRKLLRRVTKVDLLVVIAVLIVIIVILSAFLAVNKQSKTEDSPSSAARNGKDMEVLPPCGHGWIRQENKCFYFSEVQGNWTEAKDSCAAMNSTLVVIDTQEELDFLMQNKGSHDYWIGLQKDPGKPWTWVDGGELSTWFRIKNEGHAAYLNHNDVKGGEYYNTMNRICMKKN